MRVTRRDFFRMTGAGVFASIACTGAVDRAIKATAASPGPVADTLKIDFEGFGVFNHFVTRARKLNYANLPIGELVGDIGMNFEGTEYVNYTLEKHPDTEICCVNLQELDCTTFVESCLALARLIKKGGGTPRELAHEIETIRYRDGKIDGFASRLHYLTDWVDDNVKKGVIQDITQNLDGAVEFDRKVSLMSDRPKLYVQLRKHPDLIPLIKKCEDAINLRTHYFLPKASVAAIEDKLQTGDIIAITSSAKILDCTHTGICYRDKKNNLRFMHASSKHKKVYVDATLDEYLDEHRFDTGIIVARPLEI